MSYTQDAQTMNRGRVPGRLEAIIMAMAMLAAPFIAMLIRPEAGLIVMALALGAGSFLLREALEAAPIRIQRWLRLGVLVNLAIAAACVGLAAWLIVNY